MNNTIILTREELDAAVLPAKELSRLAIITLTTEQEIMVMRQFSKVATAHGWELCGLGRHAPAPVPGPTYDEALAQVATLTAEVAALRPKKAEADASLERCTTLEHELAELRAWFKRLPRHLRRREYLIEYHRRKNETPPANADKIPRHIKRRAYMILYQRAWKRRKAEQRQQPVAA